MTIGLTMQGNGIALDGIDLVAYNNEIHHRQGNDRHGLSVGKGSQRVWVVDNDVHHNGGDGIQFAHGTVTDYPEYVYIGRNTFHSDRENAVDFKYGRNIVVFQNTMYGYRSAPRDTYWCYDDNSFCGVFSSGSDGSAVVIGSDRRLQNVWVIFNHIYDSNNGIRIEELCVKECLLYPSSLVFSIAHADSFRYYFTSYPKNFPSNFPEQAGKSAFLDRSEYKSLACYVELLDNGLYEHNQTGPYF